MLNPDFTKYSLALIKDNKIIFSSTKSRLVPLLECIQRFKIKVNNCILHDRRIGLAAARLIVFSNMISKVFTLTCSFQAKELLEKNNIQLIADEFVVNILKENGEICPMELRAKELNDNKEFYLFLINKK